MSYFYHDFKNIPCYMYVTSEASFFFEKVLYLLYLMMDVSVLCTLKKRILKW